MEIPAQEDKVKEKEVSLLTFEHHFPVELKTVKMVVVMGGAKNTM
jgi:hypothetical protein